ncbi:MAG: hypothetical protein RL330_252, partial [Actinomycetota bacterium]
MVADMSNHSKQLGRRISPKNAV